MTLPGSFASSISVDPSYDPSLATDQAFMVGLTQKGPLGPTRIFHENKLRQLFGGSIAAGTLPDVARLYLRIGKAVVISRVVGSTPVKASKTLQNAVPADVLTVEALYYGDYANTYTVAVEDGTAPDTVQLVIATGSTELERSPDLAAQADAVAWGATATYVRVIAESGSGLPALSAAAALTGGTDDHTDAGDPEFQAGLDALNDKRLGPGQVMMPGGTTPAKHAMLEAHAQAWDRDALLDLPDSSSASSLAAAAAGVAGQEADDFGGKTAAFAPWVVFEGVQLPPCGAVAAAIARMDLATAAASPTGTPNPNEPAAGDNGRLGDLLDGVTQDWDDADLELLNDAGVNVIRDVDGRGDLQIMGYRTLANPDADALNVLLSNTRLDMYIRWAARKIGARFDFKQIDGHGLMAAKYGGNLTGLMQRLYREGALFGASEADAFTVDTLSVNTPDTAIDQKLYARIGAKRSPFAEQGFLQVANHAITEVL